MAADTLRVVVDEIENTIKQVFDDKAISTAQVAYWTIITANQLLGQHNAKRSSGQFIKIFPEVPILEAEDNNVQNIIKGRKYIELPANIFNVDKDGGIDYLSYYNPDEKCEPEFAKKTIYRTTQSQLQWLNLNRLTKPTPHTACFVRVGDIVYIYGIESVPVKMAEIGLYVTIDPLVKIDIDEPFFFPQELLYVLKRQVVDLARFSFLFKADDKNSGEDEASNPGGTSVPKILSVNDQSQQPQ